MMVAYADVSDFTKDYVPFDFRYVVDVYGPNRMADLYRQPNVDTLTTFLAKLPGPLQAQFDIDSYLFGFDPEADTLRTFAFLDRYSPYCYADATVPPTLLIHGTRDQLVSADQTLLLRERLTELGVEHEFHLLPGVNHAFIGASAEQKAEVQRWIADFIQSHYQPGP
jgi:acetyl esterase/lipase